MADTKTRLLWCSTSIDSALMNMISLLEILEKESIDKKDLRKCLHKNSANLVLLQEKILKELEK